MMTDTAHHSAARPAAQAGYVPFGAFRLLLSLLVVLQHAAAQLGTPGIRAAVGPFEPGSTAVFVFFVLSGTIIADAVDHTYRSRPFAFLANRLMRIVPSYAVALAVTLAVAALAFACGLGPIAADGSTLQPGDLVSPRVIAANLAAVLPGVPHGLFGEPVPMLIPIVWAVRIEVLFYVAYFAAVLISTTGGIGLGRVLSVFGAAALVAAVASVETGAGAALANAPFFVLGVAAHRLLARDRTFDGGAVIAGLFAAGALVLSLWRIASLDPVIAGTAQVRVTPVEIGLFIGLITLFANLATVRLEPGAWVRADRRLGDLTYPLYLNHMAVVSLAAAATVVPSAGGMAVASALAIVASWLIAAPTEPVIARLRDRIRGKRLD